MEKNSEWSKWRVCCSYTNTFIYTKVLSFFLMTFYSYLAQDDGEPVYNRLKFSTYPTNVAWVLKLILKVFTIKTVRDSVLRHPLFIAMMLIIATLRSNFGYFGDLPKIHLDPLFFVTLLGYIGGVMVDPSFAWSSSISQLSKIIKCISFHKSMYCSWVSIFPCSDKYTIWWSP